MALSFFLRKDGVQRTTITVRATWYLDAETIAKMWLIDDVENKALPTSRAAIESFLRTLLREQGEDYESRAGFYWGDNIEDKHHHDQELVARRLAATTDHIKLLYKVS
jgi:Arc/MetJ family transcription regulator